MKQHPIIFSGPMVRAILGGRKTMTRRVVNQGIKNTAWYRWQYSKDKAISLCPYGIPGSYLWVKEVWVAPSICNKKWPRYLSSDTPIWYPGESLLVPHLFDGGRRRHARYMPRWASRITLEVTGVRLERLQEISVEDERAEGVDTEHEAFDMLWDKINGKRAPWSSNPFVWVIEFRLLEATFHEDAR